MNRSKREDYKRFVVFCLASLIVIAQAAIFAYVWYDFYSDLILKPFWRKGNWVMILIYALIYLMFAKLYGGLKVGYLKRIDVFYSLTLATICTNVVTYFQITLINRWFMSARPVIEMTGVQLVVTVLWIWGSRYIYSRLYGARRLLVIYGDRDPGDVIHKMNTRKDKYDISGKVHIREGEEKIHAMMEDYEGVIIWDLPSQIRNRYLKYCFSHSIRCYMSPKISDIILLGTDRIHLFDTPLLMCRNQGLSMEQYFQFTGQSVDKMMEDMKPQALKRIQTRLVLEKIAEVENIQPTEEEVNEEISKMAEMYKMEADKLKDLIGENEMEQMKKDMAVQKAVTLVADAAVEA